MAEGFITRRGGVAAVDTDFETKIFNDLFLNNSAFQTRFNTVIQNLSNATLLESQNELFIQTTDVNFAAFITSFPTDFTNINSLEIDFESIHTGTNNSWFRIFVIDPADIETFTYERDSGVGIGNSTASVNRTTITYNVSSITGEKHVVIYGNASGSAGLNRTRTSRVFSVSAF